MRGAIKVITEFMARLRICVLATVALGVAMTLSQNVGATEHLDQIRDYLSQGKLRSAIVELKNALQSNPDDVEARFLLGKAYLEANDFVSAENQLEKAKALGLTGDELELGLALARLRQGRLEEVLSQSPDAGIPETDFQRDLFVARAEALLGLGQIDEAKATLDRVLAIGPHARGLAAKSRIAFFTGETEAAREHLDHALRLAPEDAHIVTMDAQWLFRDRRIAESAARFSESIDLDPNQLAPYLGKVQAHLALNQLDDAGEIIATLKTTQANNPIVILQDSLYQFFSGNHKAAKAAAERVLSGAPNNRQALFVSGASAFYLQQYEQARGGLSAYLAQQPEDATARALFGSTLLRLGSPDEAYDAVTNVEQIPNDNLAYLGVLTAAAFQAGDTTAGLNYLEQVAAKVPDNAPVLERLGSARFATGDHAGGIEALQQAIALDPSLLSAHRRLFAAYFRTDDFDQALAVAQAVERDFPEQAAGPTLRAIVALRTNDGDTAKAALEEAVEREPDNVEAATNLANITWRQGEADRAREILDGILAENPNHLPTLVRYAAFEQRSGNAESAGSLLRQAVEEHPDASQPRIRWARLQLGAGRATEALDLLQPLLETQANNLAVLETVGLARLQTGDRAGALESFSKLAELAPDNANAHAHLMTAHEHTGNITAALDTAEHALALEPNLAKARLGRVRYLAQMGRLDDAKADLESL